ncbi:hypothetical protein [uncultured Duncaniella sp.]|uniref:hypothetical protein n=1 Tax=uncultured Duncaniella sp. TaxID=2768039 RepID=UPI0025B6FD08|nr:hypothetical protein [uncultured Duncaniella sp.]
MTTEESFAVLKAVKAEKNPYDFTPEEWRTFSDEQKDARSATLNEPYQGYTNIILVEYWPTMYKWEVEICGSGKHIYVYEDEFTLD